MTGKELVLYLIQNDLLDKELEDRDGILPLCCSVEAAAKKMGVGTGTINALCDLKKLSYYPKQIKMDEKWEECLRRFDAI